MPERRGILEIPPQHFPKVLGAPFKKGGIEPFFLIGVRERILRTEDGQMGTISPNNGSDGAHLSDGLFFPNRRMFLFVFQIHPSLHQNVSAPLVGEKKKHPFLFFLLFLLPKSYSFPNI
ncbi:MAG: hypothetical protein COV70_04150 [Parcubacteria group bacterium CG11_big_fil_rev_8_21_14_0_20_39_22]|nr:MAG: hypothetical protein COV70_04150 [Parcubacteria group bacterium CG11_big_fil_rev_8_21_14_0_20_39_22]